MAGSEATGWLVGGGRRRRPLSGTVLGPRKKQKRAPEPAPLPPPPAFTPALVAAAAAQGGPDGAEMEMQEMRRQLSETEEAWRQSDGSTGSVIRRLLPAGWERLGRRQQKLEVERACKKTLTYALGLLRSGEVEDAMEQ